MRKKTRFCIKPYCGAVIYVNSSSDYCIYCEHEFNKKEGLVYEKRRDVLFTRGVN